MGDMSTSIRDLLENNEREPVNVPPRKSDMESKPNFPMGVSSHTVQNQQPPSFQQQPPPQQQQSFQQQPSFQQPQHQQQPPPKYQPSYNEVEWQQRQMPAPSRYRPQQPPQQFQPPKQQPIIPPVAQPAIKPVQSNLSSSPSPSPTAPPSKLNENNNFLKITILFVLLFLAFNSKIIYRGVSTFLPSALKDGHASIVGLLFNAILATLLFYFIGKIILSYK